MHLLTNMRNKGGSQVLCLHHWYLGERERDKYKVVTTRKGWVKMKQIYSKEMIAPSAKA